MKTITTLSLAVITALFIGCGGGSSTTPGTNNNSSVASSVSSQGSSSSASATAQAISSSNLAGKTVVAEYSDGTKVKNIQ
ncbi:MAG: hypothetical protein U9N52_00795, partial [Campylobacterota bacterium]|nr:hypothetical protein [Campylobacterota bacterium]